MYTSTLLSASVFSRATFTVRANQTIDKHVEGNVAFFKYGNQVLPMAYRCNLIVNAFNTDWEIEYGNAANGYLLRGVARVFANSSCNCVVSDDCQQPLRIGPSTPMLPGLVVGCSPLYGLRLSTLECFYSATCVDTIIRHMQDYSQANGSESSNVTVAENRSLPMVPLDASKLERFSRTDPISSLLDASFIEHWNRNISYEKYFAFCAPTRCHYTYAKTNDALYIITTLLGLYGGLTVSLRFLIWNASRVFYMIKRHLGRRPTPVVSFVGVDPAH